MGLGYRPIRPFLALFLCNAMLAATVASQYSPIRIKVLSAEFHPLADSNPVPKNCDMQNFDAYCNESKNATGESIMKVQDADGHSFTITCSVDSRWSKCAPLAVGESYEARKGKHGLTLTVWVPNSNGKESTRQFRMAGDSPAPEVGAGANVPPSGAPDAQARPVPAPQPVAVAPGQKASASPPAAAPAPPPVVVPAPRVVTAAAPESQSVQKVLPGSVLCNFTSIPPGAEITLDGKYAGNTPSGIALSAGTHAVVLSLPGFNQWKRDLTVSEGSDLTVTATLQKEQQ
jgi:hypothetical protein